MARGVTNPLTGCTDAVLMTKIRSALRKVSSQTSVKQFKKKVRFRKVSEETGRPKFHFKCVICGLDMPEGKKIYKIKNNGESYKKPSSIYEIDHVDGNPPLIKLEDLPSYTESLIFGELRVLCWECHRDHGKKKR